MNINWQCAMKKGIQLSGRGSATRKERSRRSAHF